MGARTSDVTSQIRTHPCSDYATQVSQCGMPPTCGLLPIALPLTSSYGSLQTTLKMDCQPQYATSFILKLPNSTEKLASSCVWLFSGRKTIQLNSFIPHPPYWLSKRRRLVKQMHPPFNLTCGRDLNPLLTRSLSIMQQRLPTQTCHLLHIQAQRCAVARQKVL